MRNLTCIFLFIDKIDIVIPEPFHFHTTNSCEYFTPMNLFENNQSFIVSQWIGKHGLQINNLVCTRFKV